MQIEQLKRIAPQGIDAWLQAIIDEAPRWDITTPLRQAMFLGQFSVETRGFTVFEENLNYSAEGLARTWKHRFAIISIDPATKREILIPNQHAMELQHNPEAIANYIYADANRDPLHALGNINPGDGWHYRARGPQITGRTNYRRCGTAIGQPLEEFPELLLRPAIGTEAMCWYWYSHAGNDLADKHDVEAVTRAINGGQIGLDQRRAAFERALSILQEV